MGKGSVAVMAQAIALRRSRVRLTDRPSHPVAMGCSAPRGLPGRAHLWPSPRSGCTKARPRLGQWCPSTDPHHCRSLGKGCSMHRRGVLGWGNTPPPRLVGPSEPRMRPVLLLLMATGLTGCVPQFPFYCEDTQASICYLQRRPIFAPRDKPTSDPTPERREGERPADVPQSPSAPGAPSTS